MSQKKSFSRKVPVAFATGTFQATAALNGHRPAYARLSLGGVGLSKMTFKDDLIHMQELTLSGPSALTGSDTVRHGQSGSAIV